MTQPDVLDSRYSWLRMLASLGLATVGNVGIWAVVVVMPAVQAEFGVDRADASLPYTLTMIGFALGNLFFGRVIDRYGATRAMIAAAILMGAATALAALSPSVWVLIAVAIVASGNYLAGAVWPMILAAVLEEQGWRAVYVVLAVLVVVLNVPLALCLRRRLPMDARVRADRMADERARAAGLSPRAIMWLLSLAGVACCVAMAMPQVHMVSLCVDRGYGAATGGQILAVMLVAGAASRIFFGLVADRLGGARTILISSGLQGLALLLYLPAGGLVSLYVVSLIFGLSQGGIVPSYALVVREYMPSAEAGRRVGFVMMSTILGMALGGWMSGWIYDLTGDYRLAFINGIAWNVLNLGIIALLILRGRPRAPVAAGA